MKFALGLAFQDFAMSGRFEFFMNPPWLLALLAGWVLWLSYRYGKKYKIG